MKKMLETRSLMATLVILFAISVLVDPMFARPIEPEIQNYARFVDDAYPIGVNAVTIYYRHDSSGIMYIELYNPANALVHIWGVLCGDEDYIVCTVSDVDGVWRLKYYWASYGPYWDSALFHTFAIPDPQPGQWNLGADWARHPQDSAIYQKALSIIGPIVSSYSAAYKIYYHVVARFQHNDSSAYIPFRRDLDLLNDLNTKGKYIGVCRSDAVILTAYARALGIPARIIHLTAYPVGDIIPGGMDPLEGDNHYFAEFYVLSGGNYQWVPVDSDPVYNWFGIDQANSRISELWPYEEYLPNGLLNAWDIGVGIVTYIPHENITNSGYSVADYFGYPYRNDL